MNSDHGFKDWSPTGSLSTLRIRAEIVHGIRQFFRSRGVLELETPAIGPGNVPDPEVTGLLLEPQQSAGNWQYRHLQTSPELFLKRFVAATQASCFQLGKAYRSGERGRKHNPEFTLLEWYRVGYTTAQLIDEVVELIHASDHVLNTAGHELTTDRRTAVKTTYRAVFQECLGVDPIHARSDALRALALQHGAPDLDRAGALSFLMAQVIEPTFPLHQITVIDRFPANQAALARITQDPDGVAVSERFEVFLGPIELANGYGELTDPVEQRQRFLEDSERRKYRGLPDAGCQEQMLLALEHGLPQCSGVALGIDRLLMALLQLEDIGQAMAFR